MAPPKRTAEAIDLTDDTPFYSSYSSSQSHAYPSSPQSYAHSSQTSPHGRTPKQRRTAAYNHTPSGATQQDAVYIDDDDDDEEDIAATQGMSEQQYSWTLYGAMHGKIVGVRYYNGYATVGEMVVVKREPHNAYDRKSILTLSVRSHKDTH
jgi:SWI/SNF-related matrix-associated actin-dependent regulator of chromatin subfamily A3